MVGNDMSPPLVVDCYIRVCNVSAHILIHVGRFSCRVSTVWNSLPSLVRTADSFTSFSSQLKTYMFARHL